MNFIYTHLTSKIYYNNSIKRTFFYTDCTSCAEIFKYNGFSIFWSLNNTFSTSLIYGAIKNAFLTTFSGLT